MKVTMYIGAHWNRYSKQWEYRAFSWAPSGPDYLLVEQREVEFESLDDRELKLRLVEALKEKKQQTFADAQVEVNEIDQQLQELLAIEDRSGEASVTTDDIPF